MAAFRLAMNVGPDVPVDIAVTDEIPELVADTLVAVQQALRNRAQSLEPELPVELELHPLVELDALAIPSRLRRVSHGERAGVAGLQAETRQSVIHDRIRARGARDLAELAALGARAQHQLEELAFMIEAEAGEPA